MKRVAAEKHPTVVGVPDIVGVAVVGVEPPVVAVVLDVEHVQIAVGVRSRARSHPKHRSLISLGTESYV